jgi:hypothetical protein
MLGVEHLGLANQQPQVVGRSGTLEPVETTIPSICSPKVLLWVKDLGASRNY